MYLANKMKEMEQELQGTLNMLRALERVQKSYLNTEWKIVGNADGTMPRTGNRKTGMRTIALSGITPIEVLV